MHPIARRQFLAGAALLVAHQGTIAAEEIPHLTLGIGTYGFKNIAVDSAIETIADIGFDSVEIAVFPGYDAEPAKLSPQRRRDLRRILHGTRLHLSGLMENLPPSADPVRARADLDRLERVVELSWDLAPEEPPLVQTVLGPGTWTDKRTLFRDRLGDWLEVFATAKVVLAIKPHRGGAMSQPADAIWLFDQLGRSPWLRMVYDYSHYAHRDLSVADTVRTALPMMAHVVVKDAVKVGDKVEFRLPGVSDFDYPDLLRTVVAAGYRGDVCCEVSGMVSGQTGYDAVEAARTCHRNMTRAFNQARIRRGGA